MVRCPTLAQVMISWLMGSSPTSGSVLRAQSLEPALDSVSSALCAPSLLVLSFEKKKKKQNKIKIKKNFFNKEIENLKNIINQGRLGGAVS